MTIGQRLKIIIKDAGGVAKMAPLIGAANSTVYTWFHGPSTPSVDVAMLICQLTGTSIQWLVTGEGPRQTAGIACAPLGSISLDWLTRLTICLDDIPMTAAQRDHARVLLAEATVSNAATKRGVSPELIATWRRLNGLAEEGTADANPAPEAAPRPQFQFFRRRG